MDIGAPAPSMAIANSTPSGAPVAAPTATPSPFSIPGGSTAPAAAPQATLVSSAPARAATATNVTKLQTITAPQTNTNTGTNTNTNTTGGTSSSSSTTGGGNGMYQYKLPNGSTVSIGDPTINKGMLTGATFVSGPTGKETDPLAQSNNNPGGNTATTNNTTTGGTAPDQYDAAVAGISDPGLAAQFKTSLQSLDTQISQAQSNIAGIQARSLNDPAIAGIVSSITAKYNQQIDLMKARNTQLIGKANSSVAAFGGLGVMSQDFLSNEQSQADTRIQNLQDQEDSMIAKAQAAYLTNNAKDLNTAMTQYDAANKSKLDALNNLLTASSKNVTQMQAQQKIDMQAQKNAQQADINQSTKVANGIAQNAIAAGLSLDDPTALQNYVNGLASTYNVSDPNLLFSAVTSAMQTIQKTNLGMTNTQSQIDTRSQTTADTNAKTAATLAAAAQKLSNGPTQTVSEKKDNFYAGLPQLQGKTSSDGTPYYYTSEKDGAQYLTATGFKNLVAAAKVDGISRTNFIKDNPDLFDPNGLDGYKLTTKEKTYVQ